MATEIMVDTPFGGLRGLTEGGVSCFRQVPYAEQPIGSRRFAMPGEPMHWAGLRDAMQPGAVPPQLPSRLDSVMGSYAAIQNEACLHLDIWSPVSPDASVPVLVFIHGGAFMTGGGSLPCYEGAMLARNTGLVVVTITYRLGAFGFMPMPGIAPDNLGLHDQIAALRWIGQAIHAFGGDPTAITVIGQSAGAFSIAAMLASPSCKGLFRRAVLMSAPLGLKLRHTHEAPPVGRAILAATGRDPGTLEALRMLPVEDVLQGLRQLQRSPPPADVPGDVTPPFMPVIDGTLLPGDPMEAIRAGTGGWCDTIIGVTREEYGAFALGNPVFRDLTDAALEREFTRIFGDRAPAALAKARARRAPASPGALLADLRADESFVEASVEFARLQGEFGANSYMYQFDWQSPRAEIGACHCIDLPFLMGNLETWGAAPMIQGARDREVQDLSGQMQGAMAAFARSGDPNGSDLPIWPPFGTRSVQLHFDRQSRSYAIA